MAESHDTHATPPLPASEQSVERGHEVSDVSLRGIAIAGIVLVASALVVQVICWFAMVGMQKPVKQESSHYKGYKQDLPPPSPQLQGAPGHSTLDRRDMVEMRKQEDGRLASYAWVDAEHHIAQIPIDRAMQIAMAHLPVAQPATRPTSQPVSSLKNTPAAHASAVSPSQEQP